MGYLLAFLLSAPCLAAPRAPLGASYPGWKGDFSRPGERLDRLQAEGLSAVTFVPGYVLRGVDRIDFSSAPTPAELAGAMGEALRRGLVVALKPHLEPAAYSPGFDKLASDDHSWRADCPWRGFFDVSPMSKDYREGVVGASLEAIEKALASAPKGARVRLDLGSELMRSEVEFPRLWLALLKDTRARLKGRGLQGRVLLSHNFAHHIELPDDMALRMDEDARRLLGSYIQGLDAVALSQYMDLTAAMPDSERGKRLPTAAEVARALAGHERRFVDEVLVGLLGVERGRVPPLWLGEFGIGRGGLRHPNVWAGEVTGEAKTRLEAEIARGMEGLLEYLALPAEAQGRSEERVLAAGATRPNTPMVLDGRLAQGAVLWVTGPRFDVFGWGDPAYAVAPAAQALRAALR